MKLNYKDKIRLYEEHLSGIGTKTLSRKYGINESNCRYLFSLLRKHGYTILRKDKNKYYSPAFKQMLIDKVLNEGQATYAISIEYGLSNPGLLTNWVSHYKKNGYTVVENKRGRESMPKKPKKELTRLEQLEQENLYLRAENEYLKKLDALIRKNKEEEKKKQK